MADDSIKKFTVSWILFGILFFSLISFATIFMFNNNPTGLGDAAGKFEDTRSSLSSKLLEVPADSNALLNITAKTNPEESFLGSRDSVATSYGLTDTGKGFFESAKIFMNWIITGEAGKMLLAVFGGFFSITALYLIYKWIRTGS